MNIFRKQRKKANCAWLSCVIFCIIIILHNQTWISQSRLRPNLLSSWNWLRLEETNVACRVHSCKLIAFCTPSHKSASCELIVCTYTHIWFAVLTLGNSLRDRRSWLGQLLNPNWEIHIRFEKVKVYVRFETWILTWDSWNLSLDTGKYKCYERFELSLITLSQLRPLLQPKSKNIYIQYLIYEKVKVLCKIWDLDNVKSTEAPAAATRGCRGLRKNASCDLILLRNLFCIMKHIKLIFFCWTTSFTLWKSLKLQSTRIQECLDSYMCH